jgi:hypothetical protein
VQSGDDTANQRQHRRLFCTVELPTESWRVFCHRWPGFEHLMFAAAQFDVALLVVYNRTGAG